MNGQVGFTVIYLLHPSLCRFTERLVFSDQNARLFFLERMKEKDGLLHCTMGGTLSQNTGRIYSVLTLCNIFGVTEAVICTVTSNVENPRY